MVKLAEKSDWKKKIQVLQEQLIGRDAQFSQTQEYPNENMNKQVRKYKYKSTKYNCLCSVQNAHTQIDTQNYPKKIWKYKYTKKNTGVQSTTARVGCTIATNK